MTEPPPSSGSGHARTGVGPAGGNEVWHAGPGLSRAWALAALVPFAALILVLWKLDPGLWFRNSIPALTDLTGHLVPPMILRDELLPSFRVQGWSDAWFAGFPVYRFYFPLPGLLVASVSTVLGDALALRLVAMLPLVLLPWALFCFGRLG